ncbi:hypothetical protein H2248_010061 [Termitomyces sp. 'cryptogamus']|nr:hypothetical protein H2248_010061 [Termitomyces sp. 'cryptogamus']
MPPRASIVFKFTMILSFLFRAGALDFKVSPTSILTGRTLTVSWTSSSDRDPNSFKLSVNCDTMNIPLYNPTVVKLAASSFNFDIPTIDPQFQLP